MSKPRKPAPLTQVSHNRNALGAERIDALRDGRRNRAATFRARKGKGSYTRTTKHRSDHT